MSEQQLPSLRYRLFRSALITASPIAIASLTVFFGFLFVGSSFTPRIIHVNYDSVESSRRMVQAWNAILQPQWYPQLKLSEWEDQFENSLYIARTRESDEEEQNVIEQIDSIWKHYREHTLNADEPIHMLRVLEDLALLNQSDMFDLIQDGVELQRFSVVFLVLFFLAAILATILLADRLSNRNSRFVKQLAEVLRFRKSTSQSISTLPRFSLPDSLEASSVITELKDLCQKSTLYDNIRIDELLAQKDKLQIILSSVDDAIIALSPTGSVLYANEAMIRILQIPEADLIRRPWKDLSTGNPNYLTLRSTIRAQTFSEAGNEMALEQPFELTIDGKRRFFQARRRIFEHPYHLGDSEIYLLDDVTESIKHRQLKIDFMQALQNELQRPEKMVSDAIVAGQELMQGTASAPIAAWIQSVVEGLILIQDMTHDMGLLQHLKGGPSDVNLSHQNLVPVVQRWAQAFDILARSKRVGFGYLHEGSSRITANLDPLRMEWVFSHLVTIALRNCDSGQAISVLVTDRNGSAEIKVSYTGPALGPDWIQSLPGFQGVGLRLAQEIVEAHDGRIEAHSGLVDAGAICLRVLLPIAEE